MSATVEGLLEREGTQVFTLITVPLIETIERLNGVCFLDLGFHRPIIPDNVRAASSAGSIDLSIRRKGVALRSHI